jgi:uncharacterized protein YigA (DUF484 family)
MMQVCELNVQDVANYLRQYPDFFHQHLDLLETLNIPHPEVGGNVVSLVAKQLAIFRAKQHKLEHQLASLLEIARNNDVSSSRMHVLTLALLNSSSLESTITHLKQVLIEVFLIDFFALKIIKKLENPALEAFFITPDQHGFHYLSAELEHDKPRCGRLNLAQTRFLFGDSAELIKSCAIIPIQSADLKALLVMGSCDENRFHYSLGNLFLTQLGEIVALRLASFLNE